jgi:hypothetical protein
MKIVIVLSVMLSTASPAFAMLKRNSDASRAETLLRNTTKSVALEMLLREEKELNDEIDFFGLELRMLKIYDRKPEAQHLSKLTSFERRKTDIKSKRDKILDLDGKEAHQRAQSQSRAREAERNLCIARNREINERLKQDERELRELEAEFAKLEEPPSAPAIAQGNQKKLSSKVSSLLHRSLFSTSGSAK